MPYVRSSFTYVALLLAFSFTGCSQGDRPPVGTVSGNVTMDGQPFVGYNAVFLPENGRSATGRIDKDGNYKLMYLEGVPGAKIGPSTVAFYTSSMGDVEYQRKGEAEFKVEVKRGHNVFNFKLESVSKPDPQPTQESGEKPPVILD